MRNTIAASHNSEVYVLSSMLMDAGAVPGTLAALDKSDFHDPRNAALFGVFKGLHEAGRQIDMVTAHNEISTGKHAAGGLDRLAEVNAAYFTSANVSHHAAEVRKLAGIRKAAKAMAGMLADPAGITAGGIREAAAMAESGAGGYAEKAEKAIDRYVADIRKPRERLWTGFGKLDSLTGGLRVPSVFTVGAYASTGKTSFALNVAARQEAPVAFFSLEMSGEALINRLASNALSIPYGLVEEQRLSDAQFGRIEAFAAGLKGRFHAIVDAWHVERQMDAASEIRPRLVVVDYVQKVRTGKALESRRLEMEYISGMYKQMAAQNNCVVMVLSQLSRPEAGTKKEQYKPTMGNLKESGALEADGDYVCILHRPFVLNKDKAINPEDGWLLLDKNKYGPTGRVDLRFDMRHQRFHERGDMWLGGLPPQG